MDETGSREVKMIMRLGNGDIVNAPPLCHPDLGNVLYLWVML